jgi:hypothetical protein
MMRRLILAAMSSGALGCIAPSPAQAGLFELLFGGGQRPRQAAPMPMPAAAIPAPQAMPGASPRPTASGGSRVFCVRLCDGFHFPVESAGTLRAAEALCAAGCPGAEVAVFRGPATAVEAAVDQRGRRYGELPEAFSYRVALKPGCGCRRDGGYAYLIRRILDDPTLRRGDIVVTQDGASVFSPASATKMAWTGADFVDIRRPGALSAQAFKQAERMLGPTFDVAVRRSPDIIRAVERRDNEIVVTPLAAAIRGSGPRVIMDAPFAR